MIQNIILRLLLIPVFTAATLFSCSDNNNELQKEKEERLLRQYLEANNINVDPESSGIYYVPVKEGDGIKPEMGNWVILRFTGKLINDKVFDTTDEQIAYNKEIYTSSIIYGDRRLSMASIGVQGVIDGLMLMREGGIATLIIPSHRGYGRTGAGVIPPYSTLVYDIELIRVIRDPVEYEQELIDNYIEMYNDSIHLSFDKSESGLYYTDIQKGTGESTPLESDEVSVFYRGTLTDGREFDSNIGGSVFSFTIGENQTIQGFEEGVRQMKKGGRSRVIIPSSLGYGEEGSSKIPGYTPLVFDLEIVDIQ